MEFLELMEGTDNFKVPVTTLRSQPNYEQRLTEAVKLISGEGLSRSARAYKIEEAFKTSDFPVLTGDYINRAMIAHYQSIPDQVDGVWTTLKKVAKPRVFNDMRPVHTLRVNGMDDLLAEVAEDAAYTSVATPDETHYTYTPKKYGKTVPLSWEAILNDDIGGFSDVPARMARGAKNTEEKFLASLLFDATGPKEAFFGHASGANAVSVLPLTVENLKTAIGGMSKYVANGQPLYNRPRYLVVGPALEMKAREILNSTTYVTGSDILIPGQSMIPSLGIQLIVSPWIPILATTGTYSETCWALFADPTYVPGVELGSLRGFTNPTLFMKATNQVALSGMVDSSSGSFESDAIEYKVKSVFGGCTLDPRAVWASFGQTAPVGG
jgi:hypothetical protein